MNNKKKILAGLAGIALATSFAACSYTPTATVNDAKSANSQLQNLQAVQPVPNFDWSQYRQTVIDVTSAQANSVATTTFMFNQGVTDPIDECPSIGFPVPSTTQLTNPEQITYGTLAGMSSGDWGVIAQSEQTGVYTGDSSGTYIVCVAEDGTAYIDYWEGYVKTTGGAAHWDSTKHRVVLDGKPTVTTTTKEK